MLFMLRDILSQYKDQSTSLRNQGDRFEALIQAYLLSDPRYSNSLSEVWLWMEFPFRDQFGGNDTGIDLVAKTKKAITGPFSVSFLMRLHRYLKVM